MADRPVDDWSAVQAGNKMLGGWAVGLLGHSGVSLFDRSDFRSIGCWVIGAVRPAAKLQRGVPTNSCFLCFLQARAGCPINFRGGGLKVRSIGCCLLCRDTPIIVGQHPKPAAAVFSGLFEGNEFHLLPGVSDLSLGEPALRAPLYDQVCRRRPVRQNVLQEYFWVFSPARRLSDHPFGRRSPAHSAA